jgi:hypothetical protein
MTSKSIRKAAVSHPEFYLMIVKLVESSSQESIPFVRGGEGLPRARICASRLIKDSSNLSLRLGSLRFALHPCSHDIYCLSCLLRINLDTQNEAC